MTPERLDEIERHMQEIMRRGKARIIDIRILELAIALREAWAEAATLRAAIVEWKANEKAWREQEAELIEERDWARRLYRDADAAHQEVARLRRYVDSLPCRCHDRETCGCAGLRVRGKCSECGATTDHCLCGCAC